MTLGKEVAYTRHPGVMLLLCTILLAARASGAQPSSDASFFSVLSYNVHGLPRLIAQDNPRDRSSTIGWLANKYDLVLLQEDFEYHRIIADQMVGKVGLRGSGMGFDPRRVAVKVLLFPVQILLPHFSPPYGSGVTTFVDPGRLLASDVTREAFDDCSGWFGADADCWAAKGFLRVRMRLPHGAAVDVYNTHLDAGPGERSIATRRRQLERLGAAVESLSPGLAIITGGDFNCAFSRPGDRELIMGFRQRLGLQDSGAGPVRPVWRERDYILYRSGGGVTLTVEEASEAMEFVNEGQALSDHPALFARFRGTEEP
jgi:endonuclease/exonuclease/phosphatase family metal-dependent hydrolase